MTRDAAVRAVVLREGVVLLQDRKSEKDCGYAYLLPLDANVDYQRVSFAEASDQSRPISENLGQSRRQNRGQSGACRPASACLRLTSGLPRRRRATLSGASTPPRSPSSKPPSSRAPQGLDLEAAAELASPHTRAVYCG